MLFNYITIMNRIRELFLGSKASLNGPNASLNGPKASLNGHNASSARGGRRKTKRSIHKHLNNKSHRRKNRIGSKRRFHNNNRFRRKHRVSKRTHRRSRR